MRGLVLVLSLLGSAARAQPAFTEADQRALEQALAADAGGQSSPPVAAAPPALDIALTLDVAAAWFDTEDPAQVGAHDPTQTGFNLQQLELVLGANVDPYFRLDTNIVFSQFGVEIEEAYATTLALPAGLQVRAGQFLTRFGRLNPTHPHSWDFVDQPLPNGKFFGGEGSRGLGAELSWLAPLPWFVELASALTDAGGACCARSFYGADTLPVRDPRDLVWTSRLAQFFEFSKDWGLLFGTSAQLGPNASGPENRTEIYGADLHLRWRAPGERRAFTLQAEMMHRRRQVPGRVLTDTGGYGQLVYDFGARWAAGARYDWVGGVSGDALDVEWTGLRDRVAGQVTFFPTHFSRLRVQTNYDRPSWRSDPIIGVFLALEVTIGDHAAHGY